MTNNRGLWLFAAASFAFAMGCGTPTTPDAGNGCTTDASCGSGKVCHPVLKECVQSCTGSSDCPAAEKTCAHYDGSAATTASPGFCQCSTDALCSNSVAGNICSTETKQCKAKCVGLGGCAAGFSCNETSGQCVGSAVDAGTDAGVDAGVTDAGVACTLNNNQPDTCGYGNACGALVAGVSTCQGAENDQASCANITAAIGAGNYTAWNPSTSTGPVIYVATDDTDIALGCTAAGEVPFTTTLYAYAGTTDFTATIIGAVPLSYFTSTGAKRPINGVQVGTASNAWSHYTMSNNGKNAEIKMTLCAPAGTQSLTAGFAFSGGNAYCINLTRN